MASIPGHHFHLRCPLFIRTKCLQETKEICSQVLTWYHGVLEDFDASHSETVHICVCFLKKIENRGGGGKQGTHTTRFTPRVCEFIFSPNLLKEGRRTEGRRTEGRSKGSYQTHATLAGSPSQPVSVGTALVWHVHVHVLAYDAREL